MPFGDFLRRAGALLRGPRALRDASGAAASRPHGTKASRRPAPEDPAEAALRPRMLVGTFHKTGTVLMLTILRRIAIQLGYPLASASREPPPPDWRIHFHPHAVFAPEFLAPPHRGVVVIRDPRDVIISGAHYHCRTDAFRDPWLYEPSPLFGGRSYQEMIVSRPTATARLMFEMNHHSRRTLTNMARYATPPPGFILTRFEDLVVDVELVEFRRIFTWLGMREQDIPRALAIARAASLFSGKVDSEHVRSGAPAQWREHFTPAMHDAFRRNFGDLAERFGYPPE